MTLLQDMEKRRDELRDLMTEIEDWRDERSLSDDDAELESKMDLYSEYERECSSLSFALITITGGRM